MKANMKVRPLWAVCLLCLVLMLAAGAALSAAAAEVGDTAPTSGGSAGEAATVSPPSVTAPTVTAPTEDGAVPSERGEPLPLSAVVGEFFRENAAELISAATFALTLALGLLFRKKLVPGLLEALSGLLGKSREACELVETVSAEERRELAALLARAEELLSSAKAAAERAETVAEAVTAKRSESAELRHVLAEQADLLYTLLMSSSLPQYQKDRIGTAHAATVAALSVAHDE